MLTEKSGFTKKSEFTEIPHQVGVPEEVGVLHEGRTEKPDDSPGPCPGCALAQQQQCALAQLACDAFRSFVSAGGSDKWKLKPRRPSRAMFEELFK